MRYSILKGTLASLSVVWSLSALANDSDPTLAFLDFDPSPAPEVRGTPAGGDQAAWIKAELNRSREALAHQIQAEKERAVKDILGKDDEE